MSNICIKKQCTKNIYRQSNYCSTHINFNEYWYHFITQYPYKFLLIPKKHLTSDICLIAIQNDQNGYCMAKIPLYLQTLEICSISIQKWYYNIIYVRDDLQTEDLYLQLLSLYGGWCLKYIYNKNQTIKICETAILSDCMNLQYVDDIFQTEELCIHAITKNSDSFLFVTQQTDNICLLAIQHDITNIKYIKDKQGFVDRITNQIDHIFKSLIISEYDTKDYMSRLVVDYMI